MKKIILATTAAAALFAFAGTAEARARHSKNTQYSANYETEDRNPLDAILGTEQDNWSVSPKITFRKKKQARQYYEQREANYGFDAAEESYSGSLVSLGHQLQRQGFRVSEHPSFGGVHHVHANHSAHYAGRAIDINIGRGVYEAHSAYAHKFDQLAANLKAEGYTVLWRVPGHYNHMHVQQ